MDPGLLKLAFGSQTIFGVSQLVLFFFLGTVIVTLSTYHSNDRLTFTCEPKPSDFIKQLCYEKYTSTVSPFLIPLYVAAITFGVALFCWILFVVWSVVTLRKMKPEQDEERRHRWRKLRQMYFVHVGFRLVFLCVMIGLFCSNQTLELPSVFKCSPNTTSIPINQTETGLQCNDLHYKEKSNLNIFIIVIESSILMLGIVEVIHLSKGGETAFQKKLLLVLMGIDIENLYRVAATITNVSGDQTVREGSTMQLVCEATGEPTPDITWTRVQEDGSSSEVKHQGPTWNFQNISRTASGTYLCKASNGVGNPVSQEVKVTVNFVGAYTRALKASITSQTEFQPKLLASPTISNKKTDEIFTNILIQHGRKALNEDGRRLTRSEHLSHYGQVSETQVKNCEEIFIRTTNEEQNPKSILLTGKAGIGKSLFCQKLIRDWAGNKLFHSQDVLIPDFKFAYLLTFRQLNLRGDDCGTLRELLNCSSVLDDNSNIDDSLFDYILNHPEEVLIIFDGYDEYLRQDNIAGNSEEQYPNNPKGKMPVAALCAKLIKGKILKDSVVMVTSRPDESDKLGGINFNQDVEIAGFSPQQVEENIKRYFRENEDMKNAVLEHVMNNENLVSFAHIPMLCFLMCWYFEYTLTKSESTIDLPVSATDLYSEVVDIFELKHNDESEYKTKEIPPKHKASTVVKSTFDKLSELAADLLKQKEYIFDEEDMEKKFNSEELEKLKASGLLQCGPPSRKSAFETTRHFSFTHFTVHEFLAASWFVKKGEIPKHVSAMVMQFMAGIISKKKGDNSQLMEKLLESIPSEQPLLRATCLCEYQDKEFAKTYVKNRSHHFFDHYERGMSFNRITDVDCIAISFLLDVISALNEEEATMPSQHERSEQSFTVERLEIYSSNLTLSGIERICKSLEKEHCGVTVLDVVGCPLTDKCVHSISRIVSSKLKVLSLRATTMTDTGVASLCDALQNSNCKLTTLNLSDNHITDTGALSLFKVLQNSNCKLTALSLSRNNISKEIKESLRILVQQHRPGFKLYM